MRVSQRYGVAGFPLIFPYIQGMEGYGKKNLLIVYVLITRGLF